MRSGECKAVAAREETPPAHTVPEQANMDAAAPSLAHYHLWMDAELFESLLYQAESEVLDFKVGQYPFESATDVQKSEFLKDILSFANSWRRSDAYILIGVEEVRGGRSIVRGISKQLLNRNLQQFVHSKTNKALSFSYEELQVEGHLVASITIPLQDRPFYLRSDYGRLRSNAVYVRRGDSTGEAPPDEIMKMGQVPLAADNPALNLEFADLENRQRSGKEIVLKAIKFELPRSIPDYGEATNHPGLLAMPVSIATTQNHAYLREVAEYLADYGMFQRVGFALENSSTAAAISVVLRIQFHSELLIIRDEDDMPEKPARNPLTRVFLPARGPQTGVRVSQRGDFYDVRIEFGTIQPGITEFSGAPIFIGVSESFDVTVDAILSGDNIKIPISHQIRFTSELEERKLTLAELRKIAG